MTHPQFFIKMGTYEKIKKLIEIVSFKSSKFML